MDATTTPAPKFYDVLPIRGGKRVALEWMPAAEDFTTLAGYCVLTSDRDRTGYSVSEFPVGWNGRGFQFTKVSGTGSDPTQESYSVFCGKGAPDHSQCECQGFLRWGWCKHSDAILTLIANEWI